MANDYRILDERDIKNFQAGNKLNVTEIDNKVIYEHIGEPPTKLPSEEKILEYGGSFDITVPSVYDSTGHVKSETTYSFKMPDKADASSGLTVNNFSAGTSILVNKNGNNITYSHDLSTVNESTEKLSPNSENIVTFTALSAVDECGHANQKTTYTFEMPAPPTIRECIGIGDTNSFYYYSSSDIGLNVTGLSTTEDSDLTTIYFVTFYPGVGYSKEVIENNTKYTCAVISPGPFTIPVATYQNATAAVEYTFQALKFYPPSHQSKTAEKIDYTVTIQLKGNAEDHTAWFEFTFPAGIFSKITVMGF